MRALHRAAPCLPRLPSRLPCYTFPGSSLPYVFPSTCRPDLHCSVQHLAGQVAQMLAHQGQVPRVAGAAAYPATELQRQLLQARAAAGME